MKNFFILLSIIGFCLMSNIFESFKILPFKKIGILFLFGFLIGIVIVAIVLFIYSKITKKKDKSNVCE